jgi:hypothetical protein
MCAKSKNTNTRTQPKAPFWLSLAALLVSLASLIVSMQQTNLAAEQKEASVWPYLEFYTEITNNKFSFSIQNKGIGPALIKRIEVKRKDKTYPDFYKMMNDVLGDSTQTYRHAFSSLENLVLSPQEKKELIFIEDSILVKDLFARFTDDLSFKVAFSSVYDKLWLLSNDTLMVMPDMSYFDVK